MTPLQLKNSRKQKRQRPTFAPIKCSECGDKIEMGEIYYAASAGYEIHERCVKKVPAEEAGT